MDPDPAARRRPGPTMNGPSPTDVGPGRHPDLRGGVAVVTGAAKGIGRGIATRLIAEGMTVVLVDIDGDALDQTIVELTPTAARHSAAELTPLVADLGRPADIATLFETVVSDHGTVDLLVNNAADLARQEALDEHPELLDHQLAVNLRGPYLCSQHAARLMRDTGGGSIVNLSSAGAAQAHHRGLPYDVTKGAINAMTMAMAIDLGRFGIRVNAIGPGAIHTHRVDSVEPERRQQVSARIPLLRYGTVDDIAAAVAFLASTDAAYITGQTLYVDGGITAQLTPRSEPV